MSRGPNRTEREEGREGGREGGREWVDGSFRIHTYKETFTE